MLHCREAFEVLPDAIRSQCFVSTLDAGPGLDADHVVLVFMPRPDGTLDGISRDAERFYQGSMRGRSTCNAIVDQEGT